MQVRSNVKLNKCCGSITERPNSDECTICHCRPMWCIECMAKWLALLFKFLLECIFFSMIILTSNLQIFVLNTGLHQDKMKIHQKYGCLLNVLALYAEQNFVF